MAQKPVDIYCRVSSERGRNPERIISYEEQARDARAFAERRGLTVGETFTDRGQSGGTLERTELKKALARVREGRSAGIVVAYLSRLTRDTSQGLALLEEIRAAGGDVYAPNLSDHTTADGRMLNTIQLAIDAGMRERATEQIRRARQNSIDKGVPITNTSAVGYRKNGERRYEPDPRTAPHVAHAFEMRAAGAGPSDIAAYLDAHGVRTARGKAWSVSAIYSLLQSRTYRGELRAGDLDPNLHAHEPLVDEATFQAAQRAEKGRTYDKAPRGEPYLLSGIARCACCGYALQGTGGGGRHPQRVYRCKKRHSGGVCDAPARISARALEEYVLAAFLQVTDGTVEAVPEDSAAADLSALEGALERAERRLAQVMAPEARDALGDLWAADVKERRVERDEAAAALGAARAAGAVEQDGAPDIASLRDVLLGTGGPELSTLAKRKIIQSVFPVVGVQKEPDADGNRVVRIFTEAPEWMARRRNWQKNAPELRPLW